MVFHWEIEYWFFVDDTDNFIVFFTATNEVFVRNIWEFTYEIKDFGKSLYQEGQCVYKYYKDIDLA